MTQVELQLTCNGCRYCGGAHTGTCPRIAAIDYYENGQVRRVEFVPDPNALMPTWMITGPSVETPRRSDELGDSPEPPPVFDGGLFCNALSPRRDMRCILAPGHPGRDGTHRNGDTSWVAS